MDVKEQKNFGGLSGLEKQLLDLCKEGFHFYKLTESQLRRTSTEVLVSYIQKHYPAKVFRIANQGYIGFHQKDVDQYLEDLLHDLSFAGLTEEELKKELYT
ncbi:hypothetical protein QTG56_25065 (plasmid) [Rossellomorea sp. AcN35-11]|nr:hypothetical protein [Rossellomorea aquimaris]WJV31905.1 hypothetical protein QTG56_25065 [Rossellomorea sp. AcN35-11]